MNIFVEASDVWLFRDGRPFTAGEQGRAVSFFPPMPQTVQGVIRSARIAQSGEPFDSRHWSDGLKDEIGTPPQNGQDNFGALQLRGPVIARREDKDKLQRFFPLPLDVTTLKAADSQEFWHILAPSAAPDVRTNWPQPGLLPLLPPENSEPTKFDTGWLCENALQAYLQGRTCGIHVHSHSTLFEREPRLGIQVDSRPKQTAEGMLYQIEFIRPRMDVGLLLEVEGVKLNGAGLLQLGGEARAGCYAEVTVGLNLPRDGRLTDTGKPLRLKLYLATPVIFAQGWLPDSIDANTLKGNWRGIEVTLRAAAVGKPQPIGGRDISQRDSQRAIRRAVPPGSVYFFETDANADDVLNQFDGQCVSDAGAEIGFGLSYIGGW